MSITKKEIQNNITENKATRLKLEGKVERLELIPEQLKKIYDRDMTQNKTKVSELKGTIVSLKKQDEEWQKQLKSATS